MKTNDGMGNVGSLDVSPTFNQKKQKYAEKVKKKYAKRHVLEAKKSMESKVKKNNKKVNWMEVYAYMSDKDPNSMQSPQSSVASNSSQPGNSQQNNNNGSAYYSPNGSRQNVLASNGSQTSMYSPQNSQQHMYSPQMGSPTMVNGGLAFAGQPAGMYPPPLNQQQQAGAMMMMGGGSAHMPYSPSQQMQYQQQQQQQTMMMGGGMGPVTNGSLAFLPAGIRLSAEEQLEREKMRLEFERVMIDDAAVSNII